MGFQVHPPGMNGHFHSSCDSDSSAYYASSLQYFPRLLLHNPILLPTPQKVPATRLKAPFLPPETALLSRPAKKKQQQQLRTNF